LLKSLNKRGRTCNIGVGEKNAYKILLGKLKGKRDECRLEKNTK
jgi:hypothetical protein